MKLIIYDIIKQLILDGGGGGGWFKAAISMILHQTIKWWEDAALSAKLSWIYSNVENLSATVKSLEK